MRNWFAGVNWWLAGVAAFAGIGFIIWGLGLEDFTRSAWSGVLIEIGAGVGLVAILVLLERHMVREVEQRATTAATEIVEQKTAELRDRITRLEELDEAQASARAERLEREASQISKVSEQPTAGSVGALLASAFAGRRFDPGSFRARTSANSSSHVLYMVPDQVGDGFRVFLDFRPFNLNSLDIDSNGIGVEGWSASSFFGSESTVVWTEDRDATEIADALEAALERLNWPVQEFSFRYALEALLRSGDLMREARMAAGDSSRRLKGDLQLLINDGWGITSHGLEAVDQEVAFEAEWADMRGAHWYPTQIDVQGWTPSGNRAPWDEALRWVTEREGWEVR